MEDRSGPRPPEPPSAQHQKLRSPSRKISHAVKVFLSEKPDEATENHRGGGASGDVRARMAPRRRPRRRLAEWTRPRSLRPPAGRHLRCLGPAAGALLGGVEYW